jgi:thiol-disulfide isomerase/thioredoxin
MKISMKPIVSLLLFIAMVCSGHAEVVLKDSNGQSTPISLLQGKWVFINYWAQWCATCIEEIPELNRFYQKHQKDPIALFAVNYDALPTREQNNLIKRLAIKYPNLITDPSKTLHLGDITGVPVTFVLNPKGELVKTLYGGQSVRSLEHVIR